MLKFGLCFLALVLPQLASAEGKILLVGDSHMAGTLGDALVPLLGGPPIARRYGIVSASSEMTYTTDAHVGIICPEGCKAVCPQGARCPYTLGYRRPQDGQEIESRVPPNFSRILGLLEEEKNGLEKVVIELGTNDAEIYGCNAAGVNKMAALLDQAKSKGHACVFLGPPAYLKGSVIFDRCGARYNEFADNLLRMAQSKGCMAIDGRQAKDGNGPIRCLVGGYHCTPAQAAIWARYIAGQIR